MSQSMATEVRRHAGVLPAGRHWRDPAAAPVGGQLPLRHDTASPSGAHWRDGEPPSFDVPPWRIALDCGDYSFGAGRPHWRLDLAGPAGPLSPLTSYVDREPRSRASGARRAWVAGSAAAVLVTSTMLASLAGTAMSNERSQPDVLLATPATALGERSIEMRASRSEFVMTPSTLVAPTTTTSPPATTAPPPPTTTRPRPKPTVKARAASAPSNCSTSRAAAEACWGGLLRQYSWNYQTAFNIMWCESRGNPNARNPRSTATGLFQILGGPTDPQANVAQAFNMYSRRGWQPWVCKG